MSSGGTAAAGSAGGIGPRIVRESARAGPFPRLVHEAWEETTPGLVCGITTAAAGSFGVAGAPAEELLDGYGGLAVELGFPRVAVGLQVHGTTVRTLPRSVLERGPEGSAEGGRGPSLLLAGRTDGLVTSERGILTVVTVADCVPVYLFDPASSVLALVHAGWRGTAGGILARAVEAAVRAGARVSELRVHLGPAICGDCYEVDRPVLDALGRSGERARIDLRGHLWDQALAAGIGAARVSRSDWCTRCAADLLHSHRGRGRRAGRMAAYLGLAF